MVLNDLTKSTQTKKNLQDWQVKIDKSFFKLVPKLPRGWPK